LNDAHAKVYFTPTFNKKDNAGTLTPTGAVIDASGGWWDAGDYMKFVETHSYVVALMLVGVRDFPNQMGAGSTASNFTAEAKFGLDWLQKMWDDNSKTFYYQVAVASGGHAYVGDHDIWRLPQVDDTYQNCISPYEYICNRPVFQNTAGGAAASISPNLAGRMASSLAECYQVFKASNSTYADQCLLSAEHIFDLANTAPGQLLTAGPYDFYPEVEWRDDLELAATELYLALQPGNLPAGLPHTDPLFYLTEAANWAHAYNGSNTVNGIPIGMNTAVVNYFESKGVRVMFSIGGIRFVKDWDKALSSNPTQLGINAANAAKNFNVGMEIDYEKSSNPNLAGLHAFINAYRSVLPYDSTGNNQAARLTIDLGNDDAYLQALSAYATTNWLSTANPVLDYANAMVSSQKTTVTTLEAGWTQHVDGVSVVAPLALAKMTCSVWLVAGQPNCATFSSSDQNAAASFVETIAPHGAGTTPGTLGFHVLGRRVSRAGNGLYLSTEYLSRRNGSCGQDV